MERAQCCMQRYLEAVLFSRWWRISPFSHKTDICGAVRQKVVAANHRQFELEKKQQQQTL